MYENLAIIAVFAFVFSAIAGRLDKTVITGQILVVLLRRFTPTQWDFFRFRGFVAGVYSRPFAIVEVPGCDGVFRKVATK